MARILSGLGVPFTVRHPPELRTVLRQHALTIAAYAERSEERSLGMLGQIPWYRNGYVQEGLSLLRAHKLLRRQADIHL